MTTNKSEQPFTPTQQELDEFVDDVTCDLEKIEFFKTNFPRKSEIVRAIQDVIEQINNGDLGGVDDTTELAGNQTEVCCTLLDWRGAPPMDMCRGMPYVPTRNNQVWGWHVAA